MNRAEVAKTSVCTDHWIGGERIPSRARFPVHSPIDGTHLADVSAGGQAEIDAAVDAARRAFPAWAALGPEGRAPILRRFAEGIRKRGEEIAPVETADVGSLLIANKMAIVPRSAHNIEFFAERALLLGETIDSEQVENHIRYDPSGVAKNVAIRKDSFNTTS